MNRFNNILKNYFHVTAETFGLACLVCSLLVFLSDSAQRIAPVFFLQLFLFIAACRLLDLLIGKIPFRSYTLYFLFELICLYPVMLLFAHLGNWFGFRQETLTLATLIYIGAMLLIHTGFYFNTKKAASSINQLLE